MLGHGGPDATGSGWPPEVIEQLLKVETARTAAVKAQMELNEAEKVGVGKREALGGEWCDARAAEGRCMVNKGDPPLTLAAMPVSLRYGNNTTV